MKKTMHPIMANYRIAIIIIGEMNLDNGYDNDNDKDKEAIRKETSFREQQ